jgi:hypothetical protein
MPGLPEDFRLPVACPGGEREALIEQAVNRGDR